MRMFKTDTNRYTFPCLLSCKGVIAVNGHLFCLGLERVYVSQGKHYKNANVEMRLHP